MRQIVKKIYSLDAGFAGVSTALILFNIWMLNNTSNLQSEMCSFKKLQDEYLQQLKEINEMRK